MEGTQMSFPEEGPLVVEPPEDAGSGLQVRKRGSLFTLSTKIRAQNKQTPTCLRPGEGWRNPRGVKMGWLMQEVDRLCEHGQGEGTVIAGGMAAQGRGTPSGAERWLLTGKGL